MTPAKLNCLFAFFNYGGNGGIPMCVPQLVPWWGTLFHSLYSDERVGRVEYLALTDTPITMTRNKAIRTAVENGFDILMMIDSDNIPDLYVGVDSLAKPFFQSSFDFAYDRLMQGIPTMIAAPYCGPPPHPTKGGEENVYVFKWMNNESDTDFGGCRIVMYDRDQAAIMRGIHPAAALATGVCMFTTKIFECLEPPYVAYEWKDKWQDDKASTEDVFVTRNLALAGAKKWGTNVAFCNWDAWAGHYKPKLVGKPVILPIDTISDVFVESVKRGFASDDQIVHLGWDNKKTPFPPAIQEQAAEAAIDGEQFTAQLHKVKPVLEAGMRWDADESIVSAEDREGLRIILTKMFGRFGSDQRRFMYVGTPDQATLAMMATHGKVFCVADFGTSEMSDVHLVPPYKSLEDDLGIKFIPADEDLIYQDFWDTAEAAVVFLQGETIGRELVLRAIDACKPSGWVIGNSDPPDVAPYEPLILVGSSLWAVPKEAYLASLEGNGKTAKHEFEQAF